MQGSIPRHISETLLWRALTARAMFSLLTDLIQNFFVEMDGNKKLSFNQIWVKHNIQRNNQVR